MKLLCKRVDKDQSSWGLDFFKVLKASTSSFELVVHFLKVGDKKNIQKRPVKGKMPEGTKFETQGFILIDLPNLLDLLIKHSDWSFRYYQICLEYFKYFLIRL